MCGANRLEPNRRFPDESQVSFRLPSVLSWSLTERVNGVLDLALHRCTVRAFQLVTD